MKMFLIAALTLLSTAALADTTLATCKVSGSKFVSLDISLADDQNVDFLLVNLNDKTTQTVFYSQMDKGSVADQLKGGYLNILALTEQTGQVDGVITNSGFLAIGLEPDGTYSGFLAALGNIYPLTCTK